jgi:hypothetical protein
MTQNDTKDAVLLAYRQTMSAYFAATNNLALETSLLKICTDLRELYTHLNQEDLASRTSEFAAASEIMQKSVFPKIEALNKQIDSMVNVETKVKDALLDLLKLSSSASFFGITLPGSI